MYFQIDFYLDMQGFFLTFSYVGFKVPPVIDWCNLCSSSVVLLVFHHNYMNFLIWVSLLYF